MEVLGIISGGDKLLVNVLAKVGMDRDDGLVLVIHLLQNTSQSMWGLWSFRFVFASFPDTE